MAGYNPALTYHHTVAVHPAPRSNTNRCICGGNASEHVGGTGVCENHCGSQCPKYRQTANTQLSWLLGYE